MDWSPTENREALLKGDKDALLALPPLPRPNFRIRCLQASNGCFCISGLICVCVTTVHLSIWFVDDFPHLPGQVFLTLIYAEAVTALTCLFGIMFGNPGIIERSQETCFPLPQKIVEKLKDGESLAGKNVVEEEQTYCTRCFVWRTPFSDESPECNACSDIACGGTYSYRCYHHCGICERCVRDFDHHCTFFGRCIAGQGFGGNMGYFMLLIAMGPAGITTCGLAAVLCMCVMWGYQEVEYWLTAFIYGIGGIAMLCLLWCWFCEIIPRVISAFCECRRRHAKASSL